MCNVFSVCRCVLIGIACYSSAFYSLLAFGNDWLQSIHHYTAGESGQALGIISIFSMVRDVNGF